MRKSKDIIKKSAILIGVLLLFIFFLEDDSYKKIRELLASEIIFFQGKRILFSNILVGILGSAILLFLGEVINYFQEKRVLEFRILELYEKWDKVIKHKDQIVTKNIHGLMYIAQEIKTFGNEVSEVYNAYLPYLRAGKKVELIRTLYQYANELKKYIEDVEYINKEKQYALQNMEYYIELKKKCTDASIMAEIDNGIKRYQEYVKSLNKNVVDEVAVSKKIATKRIAVIERWKTAYVMFLACKKNSLDEQDTKFEFERDLYSIKRTMRKLRQRELLYKLKDMCPTKLWKKYKLKNLIQKYEDKGDGK